ncbi:MAG: NYN domain-containing protein [Thermoanaerobaculia bacterium]|nr:NYN domain-containing protein [Thermoanaerobaculia bacterium]
MRGGPIAIRDDQNSRPVRQLRSALFVDFDNIYLAIRGQDDEAAERFRSNPSHWLGWLESQLPQGHQKPNGGASHRRILIRRCYANPKSIGGHRPHFVRAGFEVVDTPPLTTRGKTSADIHMVIDMLDALGHSTRFDEFIICSGDADFTPLLLRLRKFDRRSTVLAVGPASGTYTAAADQTVSEYDFFDQALLPDFQRSHATNKAGQAQHIENRKQVLEEIEERLYEEVSLRGGVEAHNLIGIYKDFPEFSKGQNWLEFFSLRSMTDAVVSTRERLAVVDDDQWWVGPLTEAQRRDITDETPAEPLTSADDDEVADLVWDLLEKSDRPISLAAIGQQLMDEVGDWVKERWQKVGSLKAYLEILDLGELEIAAIGPGWLYDPERHDTPEDSGGPHSRIEDLPEIGRKVCHLIDLPPLATTDYGILLRELEREVNENGYHISQTSKAVRDRLNGKGVRIARSQVSFILKGLAYSGFRFIQGEVSAENVGEQLVANTLHLLGRIEVQLEPEEEDELNHWLTREIPDAD